MKDVLRRIKRGRGLKLAPTYIVLATDGGIPYDLEIYSSKAEAKEAHLDYCEAAGLDAGDPHDAQKDVWLYEVDQDDFWEVS